MALENLTQPRTRPNPEFPAFGSMQNLKNFGMDLLKGGAIGGLGGAAGGLGAGAYQSYQAAQLAAQQAGTVAPSVMQWAGTAIPQAATQAQGALGGLYDKLGGAKGLQAGLAAGGQALGAVQQFMSPQQAGAKNAQQVGTVPTASSGPIMAGGGSGGGPGGYFSFDKYFGGQGTSRGAIAEGAGGPGVTGAAAGQPIVEPGPGAQQTIGEQGDIPMEQWGRPESGLKGYAYDIFDWLNKSKIAHGAAGLAGGIAGGLAGGPLGMFTGPAAGAAAGAGLRGLTGQLRNFFAERQGLQPQAAMA